MLVRPWPWSHLWPFVPFLTVVSGIHLILGARQNRELDVSGVAPRLELPQVFNAVICPDIACLVEIVREEGGCHQLVRDFFDRFSNRIYSRGASTRSPRTPPEPRSKKGWSGPPLVRKRTYPSTRTCEVTVRNLRGKTIGSQKLRFFNTGISFHDTNLGATHWMTSPPPSKTPPSLERSE